MSAIYIDTVLAAVRPKVRHAGHAGYQPKSQGRRTFQAALVWPFVGLAIISSVVAFVLLVQVRGLKAEIAASKRELATTNGQLSDLERSVKRVSDAQSEVASDRTEFKDARTQTPIVLSDDEIQLVHQFIKVVPERTRAQPMLKIGDEVVQSDSFQVPNKLAAKVPKLQGTRFAFDKNGAILIIGTNNNRVDAVIAESEKSRAAFSASSQIVDSNAVNKTSRTKPISAIMMRGR